MQVILAAGCDVVAVSTTAEALAAAEAHTLDCAIIDWSMPEPGQLPDICGTAEAGGKAIAGFQRIDPDLRVIIWTAYGERIKEFALAAGAYATMPKPIDAETANKVVTGATVATRLARAKRPSIAHLGKPIE